MLQVGQELSPEEVVAMKQDEETTRLSTLLATPMGKVMFSGGPEYTPEEVVAMQAADAQAEIPAEQVLVQQVAELNDPNAPDQTKDEWRRRTQLKKSLQEQGLLDSDFMATTKGVGGLVMTIADGVTSPLRYDPRDESGNVIPAKNALEYISRYNPATWPAAQADAALRLPATLNYAGELLEQGYGIMNDGLAGMGGPRYKIKETGEFITEMDRAMYRTKVAQTGGLAGDPSDDALIKQYAAQGMTLEPVTPEDVEEFEYQQHLRFRGRLKSIEQKRTEGVGPEVLTASAMSLSAAPLDWLTGSNYMDQVWGKKLPAESQAMVMQMGADPMMWTSFGAGLTRLGVSTAAKGGGARILDAIGKGAQKMARPTEQSLREVQRFQNAVWSKGRVALYAGGLAGMNYSSLPEPLKNAMNVAAAAYVIHKGGAGTLRWVGNKFPQAAIMLREAADPLNGADIMARQAIAKNAKIPASIRERVAKPSQFVSMESTPARLARNEALSPKTRKMMERLSSFYVVQGVRGASAVATGATKGAIAAAPFAELTRGGGDEEGANLIYGAGTALGGTGGAASRVFGARNRTIARAESDIGRMLVDIQGTVPELQRQGAVKRNQWFDRELARFLTDVELAGGDIAHMFQARSFDEIARTAAMQGMFRNVDYVPLNDADFALNAKAHGQSGAAGFYLHNPDGARPRLFVNLDARRADVDAHEFGEAFFSSDAFSPEQKAAMRAEVDARYGADGVAARAREYAEQMIKSENARNFPNETLVVSDEQIRAKMDELAQDELGRGGQDPADWARREIMVEEWRMAGTDYARLRRGVPAGANPVTFIENILGANARALGLSGARIDPETGKAVTPDQLFKENPVAADDPIVNRNLRAYIKTYNAWLNDPSQEVPSGVKVARDGNAQSLANNPNVDFYSSNPDNPTAPRENTFAVLGPDGRVVEKPPKQRRDERKARNSQVKNMAGRNLLAPGDAAFGLKRWADGRVRASGRRLPQSIILQNHWKPWLPIINMLESMADSGESVQVRYFAVGNSADKVKTAKLADVDAINREMVFDQWTTNKDGDLLAQFLDLTAMRNRAMRAIGERNPALDPANGGPGYSLQAIMDDVNQWMADKRAGKAGEATIGPDRKNIVNALINPGTAVNRGKNPLAGSMGKGSAIKTLLLEGINAVSGTGRKGAAMDYNWANGNFMPDQPPPRPDVDIDLPQDRMPSALPQAGMAMPDGPVAGSRGMPDDAQMDLYAENLRDDVESWSPARDTGRIDYDMQDVVDSFVDFARTNPQMTGGELTAAFYRAEKPTASQRKKLNAAIANVGEPPRVATGGTRGQAMPDVAEADAVGLRSAKFLESAVGDGMENLRAKQAKRPGTGVAKNKFVRFHDAQGRPIYVGALKKDGGKSFNAWIEETEAWQSPQETTAYRQWYRELKGYFTQIFGERAGEMMMAWLAAQQNVSPGGALGNVFKVEDRLAGIGTGKKGGLADAKIEGVLLGQVPEGGFGPKLTDFVDAGFLREFRTYMASQPEGGRPFVADVHTGRDSGHVDQQTLTRLKERSDNGELFIDGSPARVKVTQTKTVKQGSKTVIVPERVRVIPQGGKGFDVSVDMRGSPGGPKYEGISEWGNAMTDHLNNIGWRGGEWTPAEVQAVGWMRVLRQYGLPEPTVLSALQQNTSRVFAEVNYSSGNLLPANYPSFDTLLPDVQRAITTDVITQTVNELAPLIGGSLRVQRVTNGTGVWGSTKSPTTVVEVLGSAEATDIFGLALATASEQAATMSTVLGVGGKDSRVLMFKKAGGAKFSDAEMQSLIDDAGVSGYTMQQLPDGDTGIIADSTKDFKPKGFTEKKIADVKKKLVDWAEKSGVDIDVEIASARVNSYANNWNNAKDGQSYLSGIVQRGGSSKIRDIVRFRGRYAEILREAYERHAPEAVVATPQEQIGPIRQAAEAPPLEILEMLRGA